MSAPLASPLASLNLPLRSPFTSFAAPSIYKEHRQCQNMAQSANPMETTDSIQTIYLPQQHQIKETTINRPTIICSPKWHHPMLVKQDGQCTHGVVVLDDLPKHKASQHGGNADHDLLQEITEISQGHLDFTCVAQSPTLARAKSLHAVKRFAPLL